MAENGILKNGNGNGTTLVGLWKKNWKAIIGFCTLVSMMVGFIISVEARYAKAEDLKELTKQVSTVNDTLTSMSETQTQILQQMQTQQHQTIYAINSLSNELQRQTLLTKINELCKQKEALEKKMENEPNNSFVQTLYQETCNDLRSSNDQLLKLNTPIVITTP